MFGTSTKRGYALAAMLSMVAALGAGCSGSEKKDGGAAVSVSTSALSQADISKITVTVTGSNIPNPGIIANLKKAQNGIQWNGLIGGIPAGDQTFAASAYAADGTTVIYEGQTTATITAGATAQVVLILQEKNPGPGPTHYSPAIDALTASDSEVVPSTLVNLSVTAHDRNTPAETLSYLWGATCAPGADNGSFSSTTITNPVWTAPATADQTCTLFIKVSNTSTSVQTYLVIKTVTNKGKANVNAYPNTFPLIATLEAHFDYSSAGQNVDFVLNSVDPDGDNLRYVWTSSCGDHFNANAPYTITTPHYFLADAAADCVFTVEVRDLCTSGNCGGNIAGAQGSKADGQDRGGLVVGVINGVHPASGKSAPRIEAQSSQTDNGIVLAGQPYEFSVEASDPEGGTLSFAWTTTAGTLGTQVDSADPVWGATGRKSVITWTAPNPLVFTMDVAVTVTSSASNLTKTYTFSSGASDPCIVNAWPAGHACSSGNACLTGETCQANGVCGGGTAKTCTASDQCHEAGTCNPSDGNCSNPSRTNGYTCDDSNACTQTDTCQAGSCTGSNPVVCAAPAACQDAGVCQPADGTCAYANSVVGSPCTGTDLCMQTYACDGNGTCAGSNPKTCTASDQCHEAGTCNSTTGQCSSPVSPDTKSCNDGLACTTSDHCTAGVCGGTATVCTAPAVCVEPGGTCQSTGPVPPALQFAVQEGGALGDTLGLGYDAQGYIYQGGNMYQPGWDFGTGLINSAGSADAFVVKLDPTTGLATAQTWAKDFGDAANDQSVKSLAVSSAQVGFIGQFAGTMNIGNGQSATNPGIAIDYLAALDSANGNGLWIKSFDLNDSVGGTGGFLWSVASNPMQTQFAVCGWVSSKVAPTTLVNDAAAVSGGAMDIVVAVFDAASGNLVWGKQFGGNLDQICQAVAFDISGDVLITGNYQGTLQFAGTPTLPTPSGANRFGYLARLNGGNGNPAAAVSFSYTSASRVYPRSIAVDASNNVILAGQFQASVNFGSTRLTATGSTIDAFVAKLDPTLAAVWAKRLGGAGTEDARGVAVDSTGQVYVTGVFNQATDGVATLSTAGGNDAFLLQLNPATGDASFSQNYGDGYGQEGTAVVATRQASGAQQDAIWISGSFTNAVPQLNLTGSAAEVRKYLAKLK